MLLSLLLLALVRPAPLVWWVGVEGVGGGGVVAWSVMAGVARCWALRNQAPRGWAGGPVVVSGVAGFSVVVWLLDSGREHLCSCLLGSCFCGPCVVCCVCVCGDKL